MNFASALRTFVVAMTINLMFMLWPPVGQIPWYHPRAFLLVWILIIYSHYERGGTRATTPDRN